MRDWTSLRKGDIIKFVLVPIGCEDLVAVGDHATIQEVSYGSYPLVNIAGKYVYVAPYHIEYAFLADDIWDMI